MNTALRTYLLSVSAAALLTALLTAILPKGSGKRIAALCCGFLMILTAVRPISGIDTQTLSQMLSRIRMESEQATTGVTVRNRELVGQIIKQRSESYILDKAQELGIRAQIEVTVTDGGEYPYPSAVRICGSFTAQQRAELSGWLSREFAVGAERQEWCSG